MRRVTQATIAAIHGVSRQTVGCALGLYTNTNIKLSKEMRERIIRTAKELGYRPNRMAQIVSGRKSGVIGVVNFGGIAQMSTQNALFMAKAVQKAGYQLMLYDVTWYQHGGIETVLSALLDNRVEGIVLISPTEWMPADFLASIRQHGIPVVSMGGVFLEGVPHVESDYEQDSFRLVSGLLSAGYRSLVYLTNWSNSGNQGESSPRIKRARGFRRAIEAVGGTVHNTPIRTPKTGVRGEVFLTPTPIDWEDPYHVGELGMRQILARKELPEVVVCANDDWAAGALKACGSEGVSVPDQMALTGNDGTVMSGYGYIPLTTIIQPLAAMAEKAVEILLSLISKKNLPKSAMTVTLPGEIAWRESTRHPQKSP
jgi:Transcriptional regulators